MDDSNYELGITNYESRLRSSSIVHRPSSIVHRPSFVPFGLFFVALALRLYCLDCNGLWYDEVASIQIAQRGPLAILTDRFGGMLVQTPLHYLIVWLTVQPFDPRLTTMLVRLPSVLAGSLSPVVVYALGRELFGRWQGVIAGLLLALSAIHIGQSQDLRPYSLLVLFTALSVYWLVKASRTGSGKWWAAFATSTIANLYISYFAMILVMPAIAPFLLWVLYKLWLRRGTEARAFRYALLSVLAVAVAAVPVLFDMLQVHRVGPDWGRAPGIVARQLSISLSRIQQFGIGGSTEEYIQWVLFLLALVGVAAAIRKRQFAGLALCVLIVLVPALLLAVFRTTNQVFQRYAIFSMPFYFLLIGSGLAFPWEARPVSRASVRRLTRAITGTAGAAILLLLIYSISLYFSPEQHRRLSFLPDYRGVSQYLSQVAGPQDLIVMTDEPALGMAVVDYYWRGSPPATTYDARDPRLFDHKVRGSIYWVVSFFQNEPDFQALLANSAGGWADVKSFERIVVLKENVPHDTISGMDRIVTAFEQRHVEFVPVRTLRGCILQAQGKLAQAAETYRLAGEYYPRLGEEFLSTAKGFEARGDSKLAWREALTSKFMQPGSPELHTWLSHWLAQSGSAQQSQVEAELAQRLDGRH